MIDQNSQFFAILTNIGVAKQANADALGIPWQITHMGVGDANGTDPIPSATQTRLINERRRAPLNQIKVDPANAAVIVAEQVIPENVGGWWIREISLYDSDGDMIAVANCAPSFKPLLNQGSGRTQVVRMNMIVSNSSNVELKIDPSVVLATRAYVDSKVLEELNKLDSKQSVRVATTANITLTDLKTLDGIALVAGDRVLVKNQTSAKDNGLYVAAAGAWPRAPDADTHAKVSSALLVSVEQGATQADTRWQLVTDGVIVVGTTALTFQNITQGLAPINSPAFTGNPTAPTPARFDVSTKIATMAALQARGLQYAGFLSFSGALLGIVSHVGGVLHCSGATANSYSLPDSTANNLPLGANVRVQNWGVTSLGLAIQGSDKMQENIDGTWSATTRSIPPDSYVDCLYIGTGRWLLTGTGVQGKTRPFGAALGTSGWQKLPSGLILQWGQTPVATAGDVTTSLPIAFPTAFVTVVISQGYTAGSNSMGYACAGTNSLSSFVWRATGTGNGHNYLAIGF